MKIRTVTGILFAALIALWARTGAPAAQQRVNPNSNTERGGVEVKQVPGRKIGNITTKANLVLLELDEGAVSNQNLFDLDKRTIRFTPVGGGFRAENVALQWDAAMGSPMQGESVRLTKFAFPFSGKTWDTLQVQNTGLIGFGGGYKWHDESGVGVFVPRALSHGLSAGVQSADFFVLRNQQNVGRTPEGQTIVKAEKVTITIQDVIAHNGPRVPSFENSPKDYNTAIVAVTLHGRHPSDAMLAQLEGIATAWKGYWSKITGGVSTMSTSTGRNP